MTLCQERLGGNRSLRYNCALQVLARLAALGK